MDKGSRQIGSVTSEQGLALRTGHDGLESEADLVGAKAGSVLANSACRACALGCWVKARQSVARACGWAVGMCADSDIVSTSRWAASAIFASYRWAVSAFGWVLSAFGAGFVLHLTVNSELARTRGIRLSN